MINALLTGLFDIIISLVNVLLSPIDALISSAFPDIANGLNYVSAFFDYVCSIVPWAMSWFAFPATLIQFFIAYWTFKLTIPLAVHTVKLAIAWYDKIKV